MSHISFKCALTTGSRSPLAHFKIKILQLSKSAATEIRSYCYLTFIDAFKSLFCYVCFILFVLFLDADVYILCVPGGLIM